MQDIFRVDRSLPVPIYQQLVDAIRAAIKKGELVDGQQLPTVQELDLSRGTIIRAYNTLVQEGLLEMVQGRGTFVRCVPVGERSRKEQAMDAIDSLFRELEGMGFSFPEINIFLNLKLRERSEKESKVKIALVECNLESLRQMAKQLRNIPNVELYSYLMSSIVQYPYNLNEDLDLVITTQPHAEELARILPMKKRVTVVALRLTNQSMFSLMKLDAREKGGVLCQSPQFGELMVRACRLYAEDVTVEEPVVISQAISIADYLQDKHFLILPEDLETYCSGEMLEQLERFSGRIIRCGYEMDEGSMLYLQEKCTRIAKSKIV